MQLTAEAVTQCKFEATDPAADEVVLFRILQARLTFWQPGPGGIGNMATELSTACRRGPQHACLPGVRL